jgi:hypothetical protein
MTAMTTASTAIQNTKGRAKLIIRTEIADLWLPKAAL